MALDLKDMAQKPEKSEKLSGAKVGQPAINPYSYEHRISLDDAALTKLGVGANSTPKVGDKFLIHAHAEVASVSAHQSDKSKPSRNVSLQIKKMGVAPLGAGSVADAVNEGIQKASKLGSTPYES